jgi:hypothetical protein
MRNSLKLAAILAGAIVLMMPAMAPVLTGQPAGAWAQGREGGAPFGGGGTRNAPPNAPQSGNTPFSSGRGSGGAPAPRAAEQPSGSGAFGNRGSGEFRRSSGGGDNARTERAPRSPGNIFGGGGGTPRADRRDFPAQRMDQPRRGGWEGRGGGDDRSARDGRGVRESRGGWVDRRGWEGNRGADIRRRGVRHAWGPGITFYFADGYYYGDCAWLYRRAVTTGSSYWWRRYRLCRDYSW